MTLQSNRRAPSGARLVLSRSVLRLAACLLTATAALPVGAATLQDGLRRCAGLTDDHERLACYDALAAEFAATADTVPAADDALPRQSPPRGAKDEPAAPATPERLTARIERLDRRPRGEWVFHLSNGQTWTELETGRARYRPGMTVTIERTTLGGYILSTEAGRATRVRRVD